MTSELHAMLADHWRALESTPLPVDGKLRVAPLPVTVATGILHAALDAAGTRHILIPLGEGESPAPAVDTALRWRLRPLEDVSGYRRYADLGCYRGDLFDVFTDLCADILVAVEAKPDRPLKTARSVVEQWRALFGSTGNVLSGEQVAGLFGELLILSRLLERHGEAARLWGGPSGNRHDFASGTHALEVKTSTASEGRRVRVHGLDQLDEPVDGVLDLVWLRLERSASTGQSLPELIDDLMHATNDEHDLLMRLALAGYRPAERDRYETQRFHMTEQRWYPVDAAFPRLSASMFERGVAPVVTDVHYTVELTADPVPPLTDDEIRSHLYELTRSLG